MKEELQVAFDNIVLACAQYRGNRKEHVSLDTYLQLIKTELTKDKCTCKENDSEQ